MSPKNTKTILAATAIAGLGGAATLLSISPADAAPVTQTFEVPGALDFVVPDGVCALEYEVVGASGGTAAFGNVPGLGGSASGTLEVTPGETLIVVVGEEGGDGVPSGKGSPATDPDDAGLPTEGAPGAPGEGGFNGGADGGTAGSPGGGGGGASDIRQGGSDLESRVVVAGGGGGSGAETSGGKTSPEGSDDQGAGGDGGGTVGTDGIASDDGSGGGGGGTQSGGGVAGVTDASAVGGTLGDGGLGGSGNRDNDAGGGGGGGYYGGGGGAGDTGPDMAPTEAQAEGEGTDDGGGGGGGSGFGPSGVTFETGVNEGDGQITLTYDTEGESCEPDVLPDDTIPPVVAGQPAFTG